MADSVFMGRGDVVGPSSATDGAVALFDGTTGKLIKVGSIGSIAVTSITGTANQVIASAPTGAVTLSLPQDIATTSSPTFASPIVTHLLRAGATSDIGASAAPFRTGYFGTSVVVGSSSVTTTDITAANDVYAASEFRTTGASRLSLGANAKALFRNAAASAGFQINWTVNGTAAFESTAGADTAIVKANVLTSTNTVSLVTTTGTLADNAGAGGGTLTNAPTAGNPTKWIRIVDNGTARFIPTWT